MRYAPTLKAFVGLLAILAAGCSGGSTDTAAVKIRCGDGAAFCVVSCDLGCTQTGCAITEIAENQRLRFTFSDNIAVSSVNGSSVSIRTATGVAPQGDLLVSNNILTFVPRVTTQNGISTFGFQRNESYIITLAGGANSPFGVRNTAGDVLGREMTCTVIASAGIVDEDQQAPTVQMIAPTNLAASPRDPTIVLRFSELIDTTPLQGTLTPSSPVRVTLRTAIQTGNTLTCNRDSAGLVLEGIPRLSTERVGSTDVTVVDFKPTVLLPGLSCVEVVVTADLRDLSGRAAVPNRFEFFTEAGTIIPITISESFANPAKLDERISGGTWSGGARPGLIGGDGRHGSFDATIGTPVTSTEFIWDTTSIVIPASLSLTGQQYTVTDGKFYFTDLTIPAGNTVRFTGPVPPQIWVRGKVDIAGTILCNGAAMQPFNARGATTTGPPYVTGQPGGEAGAGGGRGGRGANECQGAGPIIVGGEVLTNGANGEDVKLLAGHAYATQVANTGGRGATMNPPTGPAAPNTPLVGFVYRAFFAPGGGGGGFAGAGGIATVTPITNLQIGAIPVGGLAFNPLPLPSTSTSLNHFMVGGSGGGGGATHAYGTIYVSGDVYVAGSGGSGGGGAVAIRAGNNMTIAGGARLEAKGGAGAIINGRNPAGSPTNVDWGVSSPGGGGSGGSYLLQSGATLTVSGDINTGGGGGSRTEGIGTSSINVLTSAGAGSSGFYRVEAGGTLNFLSGVSVPAYNASIHSGPLVDRDNLTGCTSLWYATNQVFPPAWLRYELDVDPDGSGPLPMTTYTDSGAPGTQTASDPNGPVRIEFQGAQLQQSTGLPLSGTVGPWRSNVGPGAGPGISLDSPTGFRFMMTFNRGLFPNCVVQGLRVFARA